MKGLGFPPRYEKSNASQKTASGRIGLFEAGCKAAALFQSVWATVRFPVGCKSGSVARYRRLTSAGDPNQPQPPIAHTDSNSGARGKINPVFIFCCCQFMTAFYRQYSTEYCSY